MDVFLTWSGPASHKVASTLRGWLPMVLQHLRPFFSSEDIRKGARWGAEIAKRLASVEFAIVCLTPDNLTSMWVQFEAGAVSKHIETGKVTALLLGVKPNDVKGPMAQFQHTAATKDEMLKLMKELNASSAGNQLGEAQLEKSFSVFWPELETAFNTALNQQAPTKVPKRDSDEILNEILEATRNQARTMSQVLEAQQRIGTAVDLLGAEKASAASYTDFLDATRHASTGFGNTGVLSSALAGERPTTLSGLLALGAKDERRSALDDKPQLRPTLRPGVRLRRKPRL